VNIRTKHLPAEERRAATVEAVIELAAGHDPGEITTTAIAQHMGVTQGALFKHFPTKDAILEAVMTWVADRLLNRVDRAAQAAATSAAALEAMFLAHTGFVAEHPGVPRMMFGELQRAGSAAPKRVAATLLRLYAERLRVILERGRDAGEFNPGLDVEAASTLFVGTIQGLVMQALIAGDVHRIRRDAPRVFAIFLRGITQGQT
jgi:TetR/AcrR family transcriptional regulator